MARYKSACSFDMMAIMFRIRDMLKSRSGVIDEVPLENGMVVLDYGTGPGGYIIPVMEKIGSKGKLYAADINPRAEHHVDKLKKKKGYDNLEFIHTDLDTGLRSSSVDVVLLYDVYHHLSEKNLREMHRVLKKRGFLSFNDHHFSEKEIESDPGLNRYFRLESSGSNTFTFKKK